MEFAYPGEILNTYKNKKLAVKNKSDQFSNFILLKIDIYHVDQLILDKPIHKRRRWIRKTDWAEEQIIP